MSKRGTWRGRITRGRMRGYEVEVRVSGEPIPIYVIAYQARDRGSVASMGFAVGDEALRSHFSDLEARVQWQETTSPYRPVGRRLAGTGGRAQSTFVHRLSGRLQRVDSRPESPGSGGRDERG